MSSNSTLQTLDTPAWRSGFSNMLRKEIAAWKSTSRWWVQSLVWLVILNGMLALLLWVIPAADPGNAPPAREAFEIFMAIFTISAIGAMVLMQGAIVGEKNSGTAAWIMSNPVSRSAFVLSKLVANAAAILIIIVLLQGSIAYVQFTLHGEFTPQLGSFAAAMGLQGLSLMFYVTLALMLGTFFSSRGPVIGISIAILLVQDLMGSFLAKLLPWLTGVLPDRLIGMSMSVGNGEPLASINPLLSAALLSILFVSVAVWRFQREEF
ncbi:MAG: ABC transporter permease [Anaerolineales bacterium]